MHRPACNDSAGLIRESTALIMQAMSAQASMPATVVSVSSQIETPRQPASKIHRWLGAVDIFGVLTLNNLVSPSYSLPTTMNHVHASQVHQSMKRCNLVAFSLAIETSFSGVL